MPFAIWSPAESPHLPQCSILSHLCPEHCLEHTASLPRGPFHLLYSKYCHQEQGILEFWVQILTPLLRVSMSLGKSLKLSEPQLLYKTGSGWKEKTDMQHVPVESCYSPGKLWLHSSVCSSKNLQWLGAHFLPSKAMDYWQKVSIILQQNLLPPAVAEEWAPLLLVKENVLCKSHWGSTQWIHCSNVSDSPSPWWSHSRARRMTFTSSRLHMDPSRGGESLQDLLRPFLWIQQILSPLMQQPNDFQAQLFLTPFIYTQMPFFCQEPTQNIWSAECKAGILDGRISLRKERRKSS